MNEISKIGNVSKFVVEDHNIYYQQGTKIFHNGNLIKDLESNFFGEFYINNGNLIVQSYLGQFEYNGHNYKGYFNYSNTKNVSYLNTQSNQINIIDDNNEISINLDKNYFNFENKAIVLEKCILKSYSLPDVTPIWQYNLTQLGEYETVRTNEVKSYELLKFIGVWQDELLVACSDGLILSLNINTGEEMRRFHQCPEYPLGSIIRKKFHDANSFVLDVSKNIMMALNSYFYMEIDLNTNAIKIIDIRENIAEVNIDFLRQSRDYAWDDDHIYSIGYVANHASGIAKGDRCILAFNRNTYKIDWQYIFEDDSINTDIPQLAGNKLYQLTANKVLHIFEKTEV